MQYRHHLLTLSKGVQADATIYFVVWWVLFECSSFDHFPNAGLATCKSGIEQLGPGGILEKESLFSTTASS